TDQGGASGRTPPFGRAGRACRTPLLRSTGGQATGAPELRRVRAPDLAVVGAVPGVRGLGDDLGAARDGGAIGGRRTPWGRGRDARRAGGTGATRLHGLPGRGPGPRGRPGARLRGPAR